MNIQLENHNRYNSQVCYVNADTFGHVWFQDLKPNWSFFGVNNKVH